MWTKAFGLLQQEKANKAAKSQSEQPQLVQPEPAEWREGAPQPEPPTAQRSLADLLSQLGAKKKKKAQPEAEMTRTQTEPNISISRRGRTKSKTSCKNSLKDSLSAPKKDDAGLKDSLTLMLDNLGERQVRKRGIKVEIPQPQAAEPRSARGARIGRRRDERKSQSSRGNRNVKRYDRSREGRYPSYETKSAHADSRRQTFPRRRPQSPLKALPAAPAWRKGHKPERRAPPPLVAPKSSSNSDKSQTPRKEKPESLNSNDPEIKAVLAGMQKLGANQARWADCCSDEDMQWD